MVVSMGGVRYAAIVLWTCMTVLSTGCGGGWQVEQLTPSQVIAKKHPRHVRIALADKSSTELIRPRIVGDSLLGESPAGVPRVIPLAAVARIETPGFNDLGKGLLVFAAVLTVAAFGAGGVIP